MGRGGFWDGWKVFLMLVSGVLRAVKMLDGSVELQRQVMSLMGLNKFANR